MTFREVSVGSAEYDRTVALRDEVLRKPLGLSWTDAERALERKSFHLAAFEDVGEEDGKVLMGCLVLTPVGVATIKMRQVAIDPRLQKRGVGTALVEFAETFAAKVGYEKMIAHARDTAVPFYVRLGYTVHDPKFTEVGLPHFLIRKDLA